MIVPHPIPYQGSKRKLAQAIVACLPNNVEILWEPFAGSAAVTIAAAASGKARHFHVNDINVPLMKLWSMIINRPKDISDFYREIWETQQGNERAYYNIIRKEFNITHKPEYLLYLLARCVKASVRYNTNGEFNQSPDNRRKGMHPNTMELHIKGVSQLLKGKTHTSHQDYRKVLELAGPGDIVYMDPPYQGVSGRRDSRYIENLSFEVFEESLRNLNDNGISYIVSYDGRTGEKEFGRRLPASLRLEHIEVAAGRSTQATLLGRDSQTYESLYLSPALVNRIKTVPDVLLKKPEFQMALF
jgi:DNA adenine methylase